MTDLTECTWQTLDVSSRAGPEDSVIFAFFPGDRSRQCVQWIASAGPYIVQPYYN